MPRYEIWRAHAVITPEGQPIAVLEAPDYNYILDRDSALKMGLSLLFVTTKLFPTAHELCDALRRTLDGIDPPAVLEETRTQRSNGASRRLSEQKP